MRPGWHDTTSGRVFVSRIDIFVPILIWALMIIGKYTDAKFGFDAYVYAGNKKESAVTGSFLCLELSLY